MVQQVHTTKGGNMRRMKKAIAMGLATMMTISLAACGNTSGETTQETSGAATTENTGSGENLTFSWWGNQTRNDMTTEALDQLRPNEIFVATGAHNSALWGELLTATAKKRGAIGAVLDGYSRDTPQVLSQNFPVFCSATWAQDSSVRTYVCDFRCTIEIGQVTIHDGDLIFGDIDGVLVIPKEIMHEVLEKALIKASGEKKVRNAIENGMSATEAFATFGIL